MKKLYVWGSAVGASLVSFGLVALANAQTAYFTVPTSTAPNLTASIGSQISDPGTLLIVAIAAGLPLTFYVIHQLIGLLPKSRSRRQ